MPPHLIEWELEAGGVEENAAIFSTSSVDMQVKNVNLLTDVTVTKCSAKKRSEFGSGWTNMGFSGRTQNFTYFFDRAIVVLSQPHGSLTIQSIQPTKGMAIKIAN